MKQTMAGSSDQPIFDRDFYAEARQNRLRTLFAHVDRAGLAGRSILEVGCGTGELGQAFSDLGADVTSVDAQAGHIDELRRRFPDRRALVLDLDTADLSSLGRFHAVLHFGLLYHLDRPTESLRRCATLADTLWLETVVCDTTEIWYDRVKETGPDQAFSGYGCRPSAAWITAAMNSFGFSVRDISSATANWGGEYNSIFDWQPRNDRSWSRGKTLLRKMFICTRGA